MHNPTPTFWCNVLSEFGNTLRRFDTQTHDYAEARQLVETLARMDAL
jgi:hypothetical protein